MTECMRAVAWWFGSSTGLHVILFVVFLLGVATGCAVARHLPDRLRNLLGV